VRCHPTLTSIQFYLACVILNKYSLSKCKPKCHSSRQYQNADTKAYIKIIFEFISRDARNITQKTDSHGKWSDTKKIKEFNDTHHCFSTSGFHNKAQRWWVKYLKEIKGKRVIMRIIIKCYHEPTTVGGGRFPSDCSNNQHLNSKSQK